MTRINTPSYIFDAYQALFASSSEVITVRTGQMLGGTMSGTEATEMVAEKATAFLGAIQGAAIVAAIGDPRRGAMAMLVPYQDRVTLNVARLRACACD